MGAVTHICLGRVDGRNFGRADFIDGAWCSGPAAMNIRNHIGPIVRMLESESMPALTISFHRQLADLIRRRPEHIGLARDARRTGILAPCGGLHDPDFWGCLTWLSSDRPPMPDSEQFVKRVVPDRLRAILDDRAGQLDTRELAEEVWVRPGWACETLLPNSYPVPKWRVDQAKDPEGAREAALSNTTAAKAKASKATKAKPPKPAA